MGTRAYIGIKNDDGSVAAIYNQLNGGLPDLGHILRKHFITEEKVRKLINLGGISYIANDNMYKSIQYASERKWTVFDFAPELHICMFPNKEPIEVFDDIEEVMGGMICYAYLFVPSESKWYYTKGHGLKPLKS